MTSWGDIFKAKLLRNFSVLVIFYVTFLTIKPLLRGGYYPMHDDIHSMRLMQMDKCIRDIQIPCRWVPDMGYGFGYPQFNYYAPLPYYVMEVFHLSGFGILDSIKVYLVCVTLLSVWGIYKFSSKFWQSETAGYVSAMFYAFLPYRAVNLYVRGAVSEYTAQALIPITLYYVLCITKSGKISDVIKLTIVLSALFLSHNISAIFVLPYLAIFVLLKLWQSGIDNIKKIIKNLALAFVGSLAFSSFFLLPAFFERSYVHTGTLTSNYFDFRGHFLSIFQILVSNSWGYGSSVYGVNDQIMLGIGLLFWFSSTLALVLGFGDKKERISLFILNILAWVSLFLTHSKSIFIWENTPLMEYVQFPWRFNLFAGIFFCVSAGYFGFLKIRRKWKVFLISVFTVLLMIFYGSFFKPEKWLDISDMDKFTGKNWELAQTISINDYLPIYTSLSPIKRAEDTPVVLSGSVNFISIEKGTNWQRWNVDVTENSLVSSQLFYFPDWVIYADKKPIEYNYKDHNGIVTFILPKGKYEVFLKLTDTPIRILSNMLSLLGLPVFGFLYIKLKENEDNV